MQFGQFRRRDFVRLLGGAAAAWPLAARAQQAGKVHRIGFLANDPTIPVQAAGKAFLDRLQENGFLEGQNIIIDRRFAEGNRDPSNGLATELVRQNVELIVASGDNNVIAAKQATNTIPIVMVNVVDPIARGIVDSLASPKGNVTGVTSHVSAEMAGKRLDYLRDIVPRISTLTIFGEVNSPQGFAQREVLERAARSLNITLDQIEVRNPGDLENGFAIIRRRRPDAIFALYDGKSLMFRKPIVQFAAEERLPTMFAFRENVEAGGLMSYGANRSDLFGRAAAYASKILNGAKPADLPIEQPTKFELVINLKTAKSLGLTVPLTLQAAADEVIE